MGTYRGSWIRIDTPVEPRNYRWNVTTRRVRRPTGMSDQPQGPLAEVARTIGGAAGKIAAAVSGSGAPSHAKTNLWAAEYLGSGTFVFHKPKRQARKRRQQAVKNRTRGMR